jgi:hydrogenase maturation protease
MMRVRIIGAGHSDRGDDACGLVAAELLRRVAGPDIDVVDGAADAAAMLALFEDVDGVIAVDCARGGGNPGDIVRLPADPAKWPKARASSSHGNSLADAVALGDALGALPPRFAVFAVVGTDFTLGAPLSPAVQAALPNLIRTVMQEAACMKPN